MTEINVEFYRMIAEMRQLGEVPAPGNVLRQNSLLRYREAREKILDRFLAAFAEGYRLGKEDANVYGKDNNAPTKEQNEPLTIEQLREMDGQPVWIKQLKDLSVCDTGWALIDICPDREEKLYDIRVWWPGSEVEDEPSEEDYGNTWVAYRRPPEGEEDT